MIAHEIICIGCPKGCKGTVSVDGSGRITDFAGYACKEGRKYVENELTAPTRMLTSTVAVDSRIRPVLPVRLSRPIPKGMIKDGMNAIADIRLKPPVKMDQVVLSNILNTGADVISTMELAE